MRFPWIAAATLALALPNLGAGEIAWGPAVNGMRLGIGFGPASSEAELRVSLNNAGPAKQEILVGRQMGKGTAVDFRFIATSPDGKKHEGFEINSFTPVAGLVLPAIERLAAGDTHQWHFPLKNVIGIEAAGDLRFDALVKQGSSIRVSLETDEPSAKWAGLPSAWIGKLISSELPPAAQLPRITVHPGGHYLQTATERPFFWLGDTAWELIHHTTREECSYYLHTRSMQGFTVIQTVVLSEFQGITQPSALGEKPFLENDPKRPNGKYFDRVLEIVDEAASLGLYVGLLPTWGDKLTAPWGDGPRLFRSDNLEDARRFASYLANRLKDRTNVLWILGGDRPPVKKAKTAGLPPDEDWTPVWREIAKGLEVGLGSKPLIAYHPQGGPDSSSVYLHGEPWLSVNGMQSGHGGGHDVPVWEWIARDYAMTPAKPTLDLEPNYEDHPFNPWPKWDPSTGYFRDLDVRKQVYRSVFAGGCGVTYGHHAIWSFAGKRNGVINFADRDWIDALQRPAGRQMVFLRELMESRPYFDRIPDQSLIAGDAGTGAQHLQATRDEKGSYAFIYFPSNDWTATIALGKLRAKRLRAWWYDPRTGVGTLIGILDATPEHEFRSPPYGPDWVLVLEDADAGYAPPGLKR
jgi:hypothetical protein